MDVWRMYGVAWMDITGWISELIVDGYMDDGGTV